MTGRWLTEEELDALTAPPAWPILVLSGFVGIVLAFGVSWIMAHASAPENAPIVVQLPPDYEPVNPIRAAYDRASPRAQCILRVESHLLEPGARADIRGKLGEKGIAQLAPFGLEPDFYRQGYTDPDDPYQAVDYLDAALARGLARNWSGVVLGIC